MPAGINGDKDGPEVFVLGAGFSRAVADLMPLTDELGNEALERDPEATIAATTSTAASASRASRSAHARFRVAGASFTRLRAC